MMSVYYHGYPEWHVSPPDEPGDAGPDGLLPLDDAVAVLVADVGHFAELRKRRAVVKLAGARWVLRGDPQVEELERALRALGAPLALIDAALAAEPPTDRQGLEVIVYQVLMDQGWAPTCRAATTFAAFDPSTGVTLAYFTVTTNRAFDEVAIILDPQSWETCNLYFEASYVARKVGNDYPLDANYDAERAKHPPTPGTSWHKVLFEHFAMPSRMGGAWFRNFLDIDAHRSADEFRYTYTMTRSIRSKVPGMPPRDGGLNLDNGFLSAQRRQDGTSNVIGMKAMKTDYWSNFYVPYFLLLMADVTADVLCACQPEHSNTAGSSAG